VQANRRPSTCARASTKCPGWPPRPCELLHRCCPVSGVRASHPAGGTDQAVGEMQGATSPREERCSRTRKCARGAPFVTPLVRSGSRFDGLAWMTWLMVFMVKPASRRSVGYASYVAQAVSCAPPPLQT
jgi:hypothetical protein